MLTPVFMPANLQVVYIFEKQIILFIEVSSQSSKQFHCTT